MKELGTFWIIGIILNVGLTTLGLIWVYKMMQDPEDKSEDKKER
jgi:hypothetical protein